MKCMNNDSGSLKVGVEGERLGLVKGMKIRVLGEEKVREISNVGQGKGEKFSVYAKGTGVFPVGPVEWELAE